MTSPDIASPRPHLAARRAPRAYVLSHHEGGQAVQVSALAHPADVNAPTQIPWTGVAVAGCGVAMVLGGLLIWRRRGDTAAVVDEPQTRPSVAD